MAEGFARACGAGVWEVESAGLMPAVNIAPLTRQVMEEKKIDLVDQFPKPLEWVLPGPIDMVVNLSGHDLPKQLGAMVRTWNVRDPIGQSERVYRKVRDEIEALVLELLQEVRGGRDALA